LNGLDIRILSIQPDFWTGTNQWRGLYTSSVQIATISRFGLYAQLSRRIANVLLFSASFPYDARPAHNILEDSPCDVQNRQAEQGVIDFSSGEFVGHSATLPAQRGAGVAPKQLRTCSGTISEGDEKCVEAPDLRS
jgi:hypothetical protein